MRAGLPPTKWEELKRELMTKWHELTDNDLEKTRGESRSIVDLIEKKVGVAFDEASERFQEIASRYHLYDEPKDEESFMTHETPKRIMELQPRKPGDGDPKPKNPLAP